MRSFGADALAGSNPAPRPQKESQDIIARPRRAGKDRERCLCGSGDDAGELAERDDMVISAMTNRAVDSELGGAQIMSAIIHPASIALRIASIGVSPMETAAAAESALRITGLNRSRRERKRACRTLAKARSPTAC
jgi:hypothetical protein